MRGDGVTSRQPGSEAGGRDGYSPDFGGGLQPGQEVPGVGVLLLKLELSQSLCVMAS